jgi:hypothetical protein
MPSAFYPPHRQSSICSCGFRTGVFPRREEEVPIFGPRGLVAQLGNVEYSRPRRFRQKLEESLDSIRAMWPECPGRVSADGLRLIVNQATAVARAC